VTLSCAEMISAVYVVSLGFNCLLASCSVTNKENIPIHYYQIDRVIELPLHRRCRNPKESYRTITTTVRGPLTCDSGAHTSPPE